MDALMIAERQRKTNIHQLLNPQNQTLRVNHSSSLEQAPHEPRVANGHPQQVHTSQLYSSHYGTQSSYDMPHMNPSWPRRKSGNVGAEMQYQHPQIDTMNHQHGMYENQSSNAFVMEGWPQQQGMNMFTGQAESGDYPPHGFHSAMYRGTPPSSEPSPYYNHHQPGERASLRIVQQRSQIPSQPEIPYNNSWVPDYQTPREVAPNNPYENPTPSSSSHQSRDEDNPITSTSDQSRKRTTPPAIDPESQPKSKKSRKKPGDEAAVARPTGNNSKRGYHQKKRTEAAQIVAQNASFMSTVTYAHVPPGKGKEKADERMRVVPTDSDSAVARLTPELQAGRCMAARYKQDEFPRCVSCTRRWAGDTCRFQGIRFFLRNAKSEIVGLSFVNNQKAEKKSMDFPNSWNVALTDEHIRRTKSVTAKALLPVLQKEREHVRATEIIYRPRESEVRATCDTCMTSLFCSSWMCRICGREACSDCYEQVRALTEELPNATPQDLEQQRMRKERHAHSNPFFLTCTKRNEHRAAEFTPVSRFCLAELEEAINMMKEIVEGEEGQEENGTPELVGSGASSTSEDSGIRTPTDATILPPNGTNQSSYGHGCGYPHQQQQKQISYTELYPPPSVLPRAQVSEQYVQQQTAVHPNDNPSGKPDTTPYHLIHRFANNELTEDLFRSMWARGEPLLVSGMLGKFAIQWTPEYFTKKYGDQSCLIVECQTNRNERVNVGKFFSWFGNHTPEREEKNEVWKLKDWPPSTDFKVTFPELYQDFSNAVPVPNYVRRDGTLNIASHFPRNAIAPDLGPKMYNAMGSSCEIGSMGSTRLHMDMADAVNIMTFAAKTKEGFDGCAAWDLFKAKDSDKIRAFLKRKGRTGVVGGAAAGAGNGGPGSNQYMDAIHGQQVYLDEEMRKELWQEEGVKSYRVYQRPGEAIFIPAGCAHQVCNLADCIKVAIDFVSPENIERCERLTKEFREQNQGKAWKEDVLQLRSMMWFAWLSCCQQEEQRKQA
ncbi:Clavaminate synthase-like protein [Dendrothele bispora CBS 962.96]|uniref:Clavaminate synthase-like protein n=1 Tax=Dendrothele bispora (strain CBS 962.96) TaxID=1314807 RepID=A0A4S8KNZ4_DENBC|nr:Clavaminate synthase-like protein [Dendrothele bispora CBS 962.96]